METFLIFKLLNDAMSFIEADLAEVYL